MAENPWITTKKEEFSYKNDDQDDEDEIVLEAFSKLNVLSTKDSTKPVPLSLSSSSSSSITEIKTPNDGILIILDLNGLLFERVDSNNKKANPSPSSGKSKHESPKTHLKSEGFNSSPHARIGGRDVYMRPYVNSFLDFLFSEFDVAVWSSARPDNVQGMVNLAFSVEQRKELKFIFNQTHCTNLGPHPTASYKPLLAKELDKVWKAFPEKYHMNNTVLLDDSPEKVSRNPAFTAIHPKEWKKNMIHDTELSESGNLRVYLKTLLEAVRNSEKPETVPKFIERYPYIDGDTSTTTTTTTTTSITTEEIS